MSEVGGWNNISVGLFWMELELDFSTHLYDLRCEWDIPAAVKNKSQRGNDGTDIWQIVPNVPPISWYSGARSIWMPRGGAKTNLVRLEIVQKRVVRTIAKTHFYAHTDPIFRKLGILKFHDIHLFQLGLFMFSYQNHTLPLKFDSKFTLQKEIHSYHTRNSHLYRLPLCRTNIKQFSVFYQGPKFYNSLCTEIVNSSSSISFKKALKAFFYNNY